MFRYMKKHFILALLALCISIITQITSPVSAILEQNMIDSIVQGDVEGFWEMLWYVALIALARALVRGIDFLILDEGVSAIDVETANEIEKDLLDMENLTLLTITRRIKDGLLGSYDKVFSMDNGKIAEYFPEIQV